MHFLFFKLDQTKFFSCGRLPNARCTCVLDPARERVGGGIMTAKKLYIAAEDRVTSAALERLYPVIQSTLRKALGSEVQFVFLATVQGKAFGMTNDPEAVPKIPQQDTDDGGPAPQS
jgi:hypothetical protein